MTKYNIKWWNDYIEADILERSDMVEKLPFIKEVIGICNSDMELKFKQHSISLVLNSFFEDCIEEMELRNNK